MTQTPDDTAAPYEEGSAYTPILLRDYRAQIIQTLRQAGMPLGIKALAECCGLTARQVRVALETSRQTVEEVPTEYKQDTKSYRLSDIGQQERHLAASRRNAALQARLSLSAGLEGIR